MWLIIRSTTTQQPDLKPQFYSNQVGDDIRHTMVRAIEKAQKSVYLVMFGLSDPAMLRAVAEQQLPTTVYYDPVGSPGLWGTLSGAQLFPIESRGLMHQKILVCDEETVFLGSANMTSASLAMHDNLMIGVKHRALARFLLAHPPGVSGYFWDVVGTQKTELWLLPDTDDRALADVCHKIRAARTSLKIALFTLTHPTLVDELIAAHQRGVKICPVIDMHSALGASKKAVEQLQDAGVRVRLSKGIQLLHHKFMLIDENTLLTGSANWTKGAFEKNSDCILIVHNLDGKQKKFMGKLWKRIEAEARPVVQQSAKPEGEWKTT